MGLDRGKLLLIGLDLAAPAVTLPHMSLVFFDLYHVLAVPLPGRRYPKASRMCQIGPATTGAQDRENTRLSTTIAPAMQGKCPR